MRVRQLLPFLQLAVICELSSACFADTVPGEYLVKFNDRHFSATTIEILQEKLDGVSIKLIGPNSEIALVKPANSKLADGDVLDLIRNNSEVEFIQPNFRYHSMLYIEGARTAHSSIIEGARTARARRVKAAADLVRLEGPFSSSLNPDNYLADNRKAEPIKRPAPITAPIAMKGVDPLLKNDKDLDVLNVRSAWNIESGDSKVVVAVNDTGVDYNHEDLVNNIWRDPKNPNVVGWDFINDDAKPFDVTAEINFFTGGGNPGHGTHCAGNVGAVGDNKLGTSGVAKHVSIMALRMLSEDGAGDTAGAIKAVDFATQHGAQIISASWGSEGSSSDDELLKAAIQRSADKGILFIAAAGNTSPEDQNTADNDTNAERRTFPASFDLPNLISVAATDQQGKMANFTHFGPKSVHIAAPGEKSFSTIPSNRSSKAFPNSKLYEDSFSMRYLGAVPWNGTSMATPQVAGAAALLWSKHPKWNYTEVRRKLLESVRKEATLEGKILTGGVLDVAKVLQD